MTKARGIIPRALLSTVQLEDVHAGFYFFVVWLWRFHGNEISVFSNEQHNADIWPACVFVELNTIVTGVQKPYVFIRYSVNAQFLHISTFLAKEKRDSSCRPAFDCPCNFSFPT